MRSYTTDLLHLPDKGDFKGDRGYPMANVHLFIYFKFVRG